MQMKKNKNVQSTLIATPNWQQEEKDTTTETLCSQTVEEKQ